MKALCILSLLVIGVLVGGLPLEAQPAPTSPTAPQAPVLSTADFLATLQAPPPAAVQPPVQWMSCTLSQCRESCTCGSGCISVCTSTTTCSCTCRSSSGLPCQV